MRTIQQVFDVLISHGYYNPYLREHYRWESDIPLHTEGHRVFFYMCNALSFAGRDGLITEREIYFATEEIQDYLDSSCLHYKSYSIAGAWTQHNIVCEPIDLIRLYRDWESRPSLDKVY